MAETGVRAERREEVDAPVERRRFEVVAPRRPGLQRAIRVGLVAGAVAVYVAVTGIVTAFNARNIITGVITLGYFVLLLIALGSGFFAAKRPTRRPGADVPAPTAATRLIAGVVAGFLTGLVSALFLLFASAVPLREMFINVSDALLNILSFGRGAGTGAVLLVVAGVVAGAIGAAVHLIPSGVRRPLLMGALAALLISLFEPLLRIILANLGLDTTWLYEAGGLTIFGAVVVFAVTTAIAFAWKTRGRTARERVDALPPRARRGVKIAAALVLIAFLIALPSLVGAFLSNTIATIGMYVLLGLGLNIVVGYAGMLDLGYVAFFAIGAYATAVLTSAAAAGSVQLSFWVALPIVIVVSTIAGILIGAPVVRLRGDYLAIVTLGFGEIVRIIAISDFARPLTGGAQGILSIPDPQAGNFEFADPQTLYYLIIAACLAAAYISLRLGPDSRVGRAWNAMREDEQVAEAMGVSIVKYKLLAFAMGAGIGCLGGTFFAVLIGSVFPHSFNILVSIQALAVIILGGMGNVPGVVIGAAVIVGLPELLREFQEYRLLFYGAVLVAAMILKPEGLLPSARRRLELHEEEMIQEQYEKRSGEEAGAPTVMGSPREA